MYYLVTPDLGSHLWTQVTSTASRWKKSRQDLILKLEEIDYTMVAAWFFEDNGDVAIAVGLPLQSEAKRSGLPLSRSF